MNILISGGSGLLGNYLYKNFSSKGLNVYKISRFDNNDDLFFEFNRKDALVPDLNIKFDVLINCAYDFNDKSISENNVNFIIAKNMIEIKKKNNIPIIINISSMSAYNDCVSKYGKVKLMIENIISKNNGYSFRLGLFELDELGGILKGLSKISMFVPFFSLGIGGGLFPQYITNLSKFSRFLIKFIEDEKNYKDSIYSTVNSLPIGFNEIIYAITRKPVLKIPLLIVKVILFLYELSPFPKLRFNSDSLNGLIHSNKTPHNLVKLESY